MADAEIVKDVNNSPVSQPAADSITTPVAPGTDAENPESSVPPVPNTSTHTDEDAQIAPVTAAEGISSIPESSTNGQDVEMADEPAVQSVVLSAEAVKDHEEPMVDDAMQIDRPLNVTDALSYLDAVKNKFSTRPDVYNHFLDIMKEFKSQQIDTPGVIKRVSALFQGHHSLIQGFNTFLPVGYRIECSSDANHITVTTPRGTKMETTGSGGGKPFHWSDELEPHSPVPHPLKHPEHREPRMLPSSRRETPDISLLQSPQAMEPAVAYVQKIKQRCDPETYRQFLDILSCYHHSPESINEEEVSKQISQLFKDAPDLRSDFRIFMPDGSQSVLDDNAAAEEGRHHHHRGRDHHHRERDHHDSKSRRKADAAENASLLPQKRKRKAGDRESIASTRVEREKLPVKQTTSSKSKKAKTENARPNTLSSTISNQTTIAAGPSSARIPTSAPLPHTSSFDPSHFFDRVKRALDSRETYNEFLKVVNLFTQGYIDTARLVQESRNFLVGDGELMRGWKEILGWDGRKEESESWGDADGWNRLIVVDEVIERPVPVPGKVDLSAQYGSYRRLPESEINVTCSGRDSMCRDVLNDEWVSHPTWALNSSSYGSASTSNNSSGNITYPDPFDDPTFFWAVSRKNVYEEALHRSEEERHEYDFHIEAISRTIAILEPINNKISQLSPEERGGFRLKPNLGGSAKAIHQRVVRKIYGRDVGTEVLACMQESPAHAVPVVLSRLKQKEEEWKRAQREWNKVWREVDARNYAKSLDHQSVNFKAADKKLLTTKAFVNEIEAAREEQMASRASLMDPLFSRTRPRHQLEIPFEDLNVLQDSLKLVFSFLDRTQGQINWNERRRIEAFLRGLVPLMFMIDASAFNAAFAAVQESSGADGEMDVEGLGLLDVEAQVATSSRSGGGRNKKGGGAGVSGGDLRKKLLKSEQAKSGRKTRGAVVQQASPSVSRFASPAPHATGEGASKIIPTTNRKRGVFFTNTTFYVLLRLLGVLYSRLRLFKSIGAQLYEDARHYPSDTRSPVHDIAVTTSGPTSSTLSNVRAREREGSSGSEQPGDTDINMDAASSSMFLPTQQKIEGLENLHSEPERIAVAAQSYDVLLQNCERLFDNEIEQSAFEDQMRSMFGIKDAYKIFTIDKLIGVIIKQVQLIFADPKSQDLLEILKRDRAVASPTSQDQINNRRNAEKVLGPDENLFRIDWLTESRCLTIQLIGKDDTSYDDSEVLTGRWQTYIDSYVANESTKGIAPQKVKRPFLKRNLPKPEILSEPDIVGNDALEIKVCVRTYRLFYVSDTEDYLWAARKRDHYTAILPSLRKRQQSRSAWIERSRTELPQVSDVEGTGTASTPAVAETKIIVGTQEKIEASREIDKNLSPTSTSAT
ncbi:histone deacetylase complex, SIN3 component [Lentinula aciculospora]|uniref:Histone deacetylase complex, SIN3 component n=1 Tax=Lentinula aciculospora TaxID=153920 RepID=A0A9W9A0T4_9AGAR|nr:histone deacetylase complex, SIN3 component [Lentinula aciculospora]